MENYTHELQIHIQELRGELETFHKSFSKASQPNYMDNKLKEIE
jgi:hypothetical protein